MKALILQPLYSNDVEQADFLFEKKLEMLDACDPGADIIVLPEYSDVPYAAKTADELKTAHKKYYDTLMSRCRQTAVRCNAVVFVNALSENEDGYRNTTYAIDKSGEIVGHYYKTHIPPSERQEGVTYHYTEDLREPYVLTIDGIRYGFLTCYDFYFYEAFSKIAERDVDVIIGCSLQRSDTHEASEIICRFLAYNTNAYVLRSSVSYDNQSNVCGASMAVAPDGKVLLNMRGDVGIGSVTFDPSGKYYKPAGFGRKDASHHEYIEEGRCPWQYRPAGSAVVLDDAHMPYPRVCAHRGFNTLAPENSMAAFGAAIGLGAEEIELDIWPTKDGQLVCSHDSTLDRISTGTGNIWEYTYEELLQLDFGIRRGEIFRGLPVLLFEDVLKKFAGLVIMNLHVKIWDMEFEDSKLEMIAGLIKKYSCEKYVYFMTISDRMLMEVKEKYPEFRICVGHRKECPYEIVNRAIRIGAEKVQLYRPYFNKEMVDLAHEHGIICNVFWSDDAEHTKEYLDMGIDTILTNDYYQTARLVEEFTRGQL